MRFVDIFTKGFQPEQDDDYDETEYKPDTEYIPQDPRLQPSTQIPSSTKGVQSSSGTNVSGSAIEMKVVKPDRFEAVADIANLLLANNTVLLNLEDTNKETTRRLIDFMTGVAYAIQGDLRRIANNTYVVTPNNVRVSDSEDAGGAPKDGADAV